MNRLHSVIGEKIRCALIKWEEALFSQSRNLPVSNRDMILMEIPHNTYSDCFFFLSYYVNYGFCMNGVTFMFL